MLAANFIQFDEAGIHPVMKKNLELCMYSWPTAIQCYTIPAIHEQRDVIGIAQTGKPCSSKELRLAILLTLLGSGKTGAFLIPILSKLMGKAKKLAAPRPNIAEGWDPKVNAVHAEPLVLIVCPTRELANQIFDDARRLCSAPVLCTVVLRLAYSGRSFRRDATSSSAPLAVSWISCVSPMCCPCAVFGMCKYCDNNTFVSSSD
jgi:ATP-dependent RNA helicase DDX3X